MAGWTSAMTYNASDWEHWMGAEAYDALMPWLQAHGPDEWHGSAISWNYGHGIAPLAWICLQPDCDLATAQGIFWKCNGAEHFESDRILRSDNPQDFDRGFDLARLIGQRWVAGGFTRHKIRFQRGAFETIQQEHARYESYLRNYDSRLIPWRAPTPTQPVDGYVIDENFFNEGIPCNLAIYPSYDDQRTRSGYLKLLAYVHRNVDQGRMEKPAYWFGEKLGWIKSSEIPDYRTMPR